MEQTAQTVTDPVCLMKIKPEDAAARSEYQGREFYFCADNCRRAFEQDPERYASRAA
jgi:Cu+-exporting ATPase